MSDLLVVVGSDATRANGFGQLAALFEGLNQRPLADSELSAWAGCGVVSKEFGAPQTVVRDAESGAFLAIVGTWVGARTNSPNSAAELLARCLREPMHQVARDIDGAFVLAFADPRTRSMLIATDIVGSLHVFLARLPGGVALCTSARALAAMGSGGLDPLAVQEFWATGVIYEDRSLWAGVRKLGPATVLAIDADGAIRESSYWSFEEVNGRSLSLREASAQLGDALANAALRIGRAYPRALADVTGGYDSRATICGFVRAGVPFSATVSGPINSADVVLSGQISRALNIPHYHADVQAERTAAVLTDALALTDGEYELVEYARIAAIHRGHGQRGFSCSINGSFGELARGYWWELLFPWLGAARPLDAELLARKRYAVFPFDASAIEPAVRVDFKAHMRDVINRSNAPLAGKPNTTQMDHAYVDLRMQRWQGRIGSSTAHIWPSFSPFMFRSLLMPMLDATPVARWRSLLVRRMLTDMTPALANLPLEHGYPATTARLANLHRFAPVLGHYARRVGEKLSRRQQAPESTSSDSVLLEQLGLQKVGDWKLARGDIFAASRIGHYIDSAAKQGLSVAGRRLLTLELALRSVVQARHGRGHAA